MTWHSPTASTTSLRSYIPPKRLCTSKIRNLYVQKTWKLSTNLQDNGQSTLDFSDIAQIATAIVAVNLYSNSVRNPPAASLLQLRLLRLLRLQQRKVLTTNSISSNLKNSTRWIS